MQEAGSAGEAKASGSLYDWWFGALPALFGAAGKGEQAAAPKAADAINGDTLEATTARISQALQMTQQLLTSVYSAYFGALIGKPAAAPTAAFEDLLRSRLDELGKHWSGMSKALAGPAEIEAALSRLGGGLTSSIAELARPLASNVERAYGGVADAFGLAPMRELEAAGRELALARVAQRRAQAEYLEVTLDALRQGGDALTARLAEMGRRGESVDTMLALMRLCVRTLDGAMHEAMQSPRALQVAAEAIRAGLRAKQQQQRIVALASQALNVPTRAEVDEAYREIQELKREVRRLRKSAPVAHGPTRELAREAAPLPKPRKRAAPRLKNASAAA